MSVAAFKAGLRAHLQANAGVSALVSTRVYPIAVPEGAGFPLVTYTVVDTAVESAFRNAVGLRAITVDFMAVDEDSETPDEVADAIEAALLANIGDIGESGILVQDCSLSPTEARSDSYMPETGLYGVRSRFIFTI